MPPDTAPIPLPDGCEAVSDYVARMERVPGRKEALDRARARLGAAIAAGEAAVTVQPLAVAPDGRLVEVGPARQVPLGRRGSRRSGRWTR
jgi:hypothetical protein